MRSGEHEEIMRALQQEHAKKINKRPPLQLDPPNAQEFLDRGPAEEGTYLVRELLLEQTHTIWQGRPKVGKSHIMLQLAVDAASGKQVFGTFQVPRPVLVLYCELEEPEAVTKRRFIDMLAANDNEGPEKNNLHFLTRVDLHRWKLLPRELLFAALPTFITMIKDRGVELVVLVALRVLFTGDRNDQEIAERFNAALDLLAQETRTSLALVHHTRKADAETAEAAGIGSTMLAARADAIFDIRKTAEGIRRVRVESRYPATDNFYLRRFKVQKGERIVAADDPRAPQIAQLREKIGQGISLRQAAKAAGIAWATAQRLSKDL